MSTTAISRLLLPLFVSLILPFSAAAKNSNANDNGHSQNPYPIELEIVSPVAHKVKNGKPKNSKNIQYRSGWPLTLKLSTSDKFLLGTYVPGTGSAPASEFPESGTPAWLIFSDDDDCLYLEGHAEPASSLPCDDQTGAGEVFLGFAPDVDFPGLEDLDPGGGAGELRSHGRPDLRAALADLDFGPEWGGPYRSGQLDGVGYGPNDDLPGLMIISNTGVGIVYDPLEFEDDCDPEKTPNCEICLIENCPIPVLIVPPLGVLERWERAVPEARHNLSGLMGMVGYELNDQKLRTTVTTNLLVPRYMFSHLELRDPCYQGGPNCLSSRTRDAANRIDAGPINFPWKDTSISIVELRAFVINGTAPASLEDCNGDGQVTAKDAECEGYDLISNEIALEITQFGNLVEECNNMVDPWSVVAGPFGFGQNVKLVDLNRNLNPFGIACPGGSGGVLPPPR